MFRLIVKTFKAAALLLCCAGLLMQSFSASALSLTDAPLASTVLAGATQLAKDPQQTVTPGHVVTNVYRYASRSTIIGCLENGTILKILDTRGSYYRIDCYDMVGYIPVSQVQKNDNGQYYVNCVADSVHTKTLASFSTQAADSLRGIIRERATALQGIPYVWGGTTTNGFDCSGFTQYVLRKAGLDIHRSVLMQLQDGIIIAKEDLQCGDLVFFENTTGDGHFASHIGIYLGDGKLIHSGSHGIAIVNLSDSYFTYHYMCARRVVLSDLTPTTMPNTVLSFQRPVSAYRRSTAAETVEEP